MSPEKESLTPDGLIKAGIDGKSRAISNYDDMIWKVRGGYVAVLYGSFTLVAGFGETTSWSLSIQAAAAVAIILIASFSGCAFLMDFHLSESKMKVVQTKEELVDLATEVAFGEAIAGDKIARLKLLLHNSGEALMEVDWQSRPARWPFWLLYAGTGIMLCLATLVIAAQGESAGLPVASNG